MASSGNFVCAQINSGYTDLNLPTKLYNALEKNNPTVRVYALQLPCGKKIPLSIPVERKALQKVYAKAISGLFNNDELKSSLTKEYYTAEELYEVLESIA